VGVLPISQLAYEGDLKEAWSTIEVTPGMKKKVTWYPRMKQCVKLGDWRDEPNKEWYKFICNAKYGAGDVPCPLQRLYVATVCPYQTDRFTATFGFSSALRFRCRTYAYFRVTGLFAGAVFASELVRMSA
jgi:hypothetical protein